MSGPDASRFTAWSGPGPSGPPQSFTEEPTAFDTSRFLRFPAFDSNRAVELLGDLERARRADVLPIPARAVAQLLGRVGARFTQPDDSLRREALAWLPATAGISREMAERVVDGMALDWHVERLERAMELDLGAPECLDGFTGPSDARSLAVALSPAVHVGSGNVPGVTATSLIRSMLVKGAALVKPGRGDVVLPVLLHRGLRQESAALARASAVWYWPGGAAGEAELFQRARAVVLYGGPRAAELARRDLGPTTRLVLHPHRVSAAIVDAPTAAHDTKRVSTALAMAVAMFDRRGCVSPHVLYLEESDASRVTAFTEAVAEELSRLDRELPPGPEHADEASSRHQALGTLRLQAASGEALAVRAGPRWAVVVDRRSGFAAAPPGRVLRIRPVSSLDAAVEELASVSPLVQSVAVEVAEDRRARLLLALAVSGATRITTLERLPWPPAWWNHDGRGPLTELVERVDLEG